MTHARTHAPGFPSALALVVALAGPSLFVVVSDRLFGDQPSLPIQIGVQLLYGGLAAFVVWVVTGWERLPLHSIGLRRPDRSTIITSVLLWAALYVQSVLTAPLVVPADGSRPPRDIVEGHAAAPVPDGRSLVFERDERTDNLLFVSGRMW